MGKDYFDIREARERIAELEVELADARAAPSPATPEAEGGLKRRAGKLLQHLIPAAQADCLMDEKYSSIVAITLNECEEVISALLLASPPAAQEQKPAYKSVTELCAENQELREYLEQWDPVKFIPNPLVCEAAVRSIEDTRVLEKFLTTLNAMRDTHKPSDVASPIPALGWVMVPREPTEAMKSDGCNAYIERGYQDNCNGAGDCADACYKAMLAAAPVAPENTK